MGIYLLSFFSITFSILIFNFFASNLRLLDKPNHRKIHKNNVPLIGGISIYTSLIFVSIFLNLENTLYLIISVSSIIILLGILDDIKNLGYKVRLLSQIFATLILIGSGISITVIEFIDTEIFQIKSLALLFTVICVVGMTNAFNFIDGIDGLASGLSLLAFFSIQFFIFMNIGFDNNPEPILVNVFIIVFIFFIFNVFTKRKIFLGDAGSNFLGFFISFLLIYYSHFSVYKIHSLQTIWCVSLPFFDFFAVFILRILNRKSPFLADNNHLHHLLYFYFKSQKITLLILLSLAISILLIGVISINFLGNNYSLIIYIILMMVYIFFYNIIYKKIKNNG